MTNAYNRFLQARVAYPDGDPTHVSEILPGLISVIDKWRKLNPDEEERPATTCATCGVGIKGGRFCEIHEVAW